MKSQEETIAKFGDETNGLLLDSFVEERARSDFARNGQYMVQQMRRARDLLKRIHAFIVEAPEPQPLPSKPASHNGNGHHSTQVQKAK